ncbi:hypothetical protein FGIG_00889 [Fasciola gigantica]|uniref:Uncharacterized protein n=1 Tax=Fasciola gigantica TaxID=46835 RepID=A0A504YV39_FASGI|nr:hypothetical protein FGIG_00889 [Fasciola gigantica]
MPPNLTDSPATPQRVKPSVVGDLIPLCGLVYLDDAVVIGRILNIQIQNSAYELESFRHERLAAYAFQVSSITMPGDSPGTRRDDSRNSGWSIKNVKGYNVAYFLNRRRRTQFP